MVKVITTKPLDGQPEGVEREFDQAEFDMLKGFGAVRAIEDDGLRSDGPTVEEYVTAGYRATAYPPSGYASRSSAEEVAAAIAAQEPVSSTAGQSGTIDTASGTEPPPEVGTDAAPETDGEKSGPEVENKAAPGVANKAARKPSNKAD